ncbi:MAG TPA: fibronectin type III domain-containing protein, partial [Polyangiaceae bacterium]
QVAYDDKHKALYAATGPEGKLYRISESGDAQVYFDAPEQQLMSVAVAPDGTVYAGASDKAKLYKITAPGRASVLYDFARTEVRGIAVNKKGEVYAIANEIKPGTQAPTRRNEGTPAQPANVANKSKGKGTLYKFSLDGSPDQLLDDTDEHYTSLVLGDDGRPYVGTGVEGRVYTVDANHNSVLVADVDERQVSALLLAGKEQFVLASDPAVVHPVKGIGGADAVWTSKVLDAGLRARFGKITWEASGPLQISTRTGNTKEPDDTWSAWSNGFNAPALIDSPAARYLQVRARFEKDPNAVLSEIGISFLTDNLRAVLTNVEAKDSDSSESDDSIHSSGGPVTHKPDSSISLSWKVDNPDKDDLRFRLQYRQVGSQTWFDLLKPQEKLTKESYSWETADLPEGRYRVRVVATDELSNPPDRVTRDEMESSVVLVDNTPPVIEGLKVVGKRVQGVAIDGVGPIARIEISQAGSDEWTPFYPTDGIFDEPREEFDADVSKLLPVTPALLTLRVYDKANNFVVRSILLK